MHSEILLKESDLFIRTPEVVNQLYQMILNLEDRVEDLEMRLNEFEEGDD